MEKPTAFIDLPASAYPFVMERFDRNGVLIDTETVKGPGAIDVRAAEEHQKPVSVRITFADGTVSEG